MTPRVLLATMEVLQGRSVCARELAAIVFCHRRTAARMLLHLHRKGLVYITGWQRGVGPMLPIYALGVGVDVDKPAPLTALEKVRMYRARVSVEERDFAMARRRQLRRKLKVDPLTAAFFGRMK